MKELNLIIILAGTLIITPAFSQTPEYSPYFSVLPDLPDQNKGSGYYKRNARRSSRRDRYSDASLYAIAWVTTEDKERKKKKAYKLLKEVLPKALVQLEERISSLEADTISLSGEELLNNVRRIKKLYLTLSEIQSRHDELDEKWAVKNAGFREDYNARLQPINQQLGSVITRLAENHYQQAQQLVKQKPESRQEYLKVARALKECREYYPDYKDVAQQYKEYRQKATTRLAILPIRNESSYEQVFTTPLQKALYGELRKKLASEPLEFFQLVPLKFADVPEKRNVGFKLEILGFQVKKEAVEPTETKREKGIVNEKTKKEGTISATFISYSKSASVSIEAKYTIVDLDTQTVLATKALVFPDIHAWKHDWYRSRGNQQALKKGERRLLKSSSEDKPFPNNVKLAQIAMDNIRFHDSLAGHILPFAKKYGQ